MARASIMMSSSCRCSVAAAASRTTRARRRRARRARRRARAATSPTRSHVVDARRLHPRRGALQARRLARGQAHLHALEGLRLAAGQGLRADHQRQPAPVQEVQLPRGLGRHRQGPDEPARGELRARLRRGSRLVGGAGAQGGRRRRSGVGGGRQRARAEGGIS